MTSPDSGATQRNPGRPASPDPKPPYAPPWREGAGETVGLQPWLPWPLGRSRWWTQPVRAERLAALRIGLAGWLLLDVLTTYLPGARDFFGRDSLGAPPVFNYLWTTWKWNWTILYGVEDHGLIRLAMLVWVVALVGLLFGFWTRTCAVAVWVLSTSFANLNSCIDNAGDSVRGILLFYLMLAPCGAVWSVDAWKRGRRGPVFIYPWVLRLIFLQMVVIYWANGIHKLTGATWQQGTSLYYVLGDATLTRWSPASLPQPYLLSRLLTWLVLGWEALFPALMLYRPIRVVALFFGAAFHVGIWVSMELGFFAPYMLCMYLPLIPWEWWADRRRRGKAPLGDVAANAKPIPSA